MCSVPCTPLTFFVTFNNTLPFRDSILEVPSKPTSIRCLILPKLIVAETLLRSTCSLNAILFIEPVAVTPVIALLVFTATLFMNVVPLTLLILTLVLVVSVTVLTLPVAETLLSFSEGFSETVFTEPVAVTPTMLNALWPFSVPTLL